MSNDDGQLLSPPPPPDFRIRPAGSLPDRQEADGSVWRVHVFHIGDRDGRDPHGRDAGWTAPRRADVATDSDSPAKACQAGATDPRARQPDPALMPQIFSFGDSITPEPFRAIEIHVRVSHAVWPGGQALCHLLRAPKCKVEMWFVQDGETGQISDLAPYEYGMFGGRR